jgi:hypothetical protein
MDGSVESADPAANAAAKTYISWWPAGAALKGPITPISRRPGGERTLLSDMRNEISNSSQLGLRDGRFTPRSGQATVFAGELDVSSGPLNVLDHASATEHERFMETLFAPEADGGGSHKREKVPATKTGESGQTRRANYPDLVAGTFFPPRGAPR